MNYCTILFAAPVLFQFLDRIVAWVPMQVLGMGKEEFSALHRIAFSVNSCYQKISNFPFVFPIHTATTCTYWFSSDITLVVVEGDIIIVSDRVSLKWVEVGKLHSDIIVSFYWLIPTFSFDWLWTIRHDTMVDRAVEANFLNFCWSTNLSPSVIREVSRKNWRLLLCGYQTLCVDT